MALADADLVGAGWQVTEAALRTFLGSSRLASLASSDRELRALGILLGGDVTILQERMAIVSTAMPEVQTDESTLMTAAVTGMIEAREAKGSGWSTASRLDEFTDEAGIDAALSALQAIDGVRVPSGTCTVVFGPQAVADLVSNIVVPACLAPSFHASNTPFLGKLGRQVAWPSLTIADQGARAGLVGSKGITCEGLPTGRTDLVRDGVLVGCLASWYETQRLLRDEALGEKLGVVGEQAAAALAPRNGFRFGDGGGRNFDTTPGVSASNVVVESAETVSRAELLRRVGDGLYVGRIWYTYVINGLRAGDFTCTVIADSHLIRDGRLAAPLRPNTVRISDNIVRVLENIVGVGGPPRATPVWAADEVVYAPELAVRGVPVDSIAGFLDEL
jgi:predicted Zn-dependent protease